MKPGLYEQIINKQMNEELASVPEECRYQEKVDSAEASRVLATYAAELMKRKMDAIYEASGDQALSDQIAYINKVIRSMDVAADEVLQIEHPGEQLLSLLSEKDEQRLLGKKAKDALRPETSMAYSSLFTGASREPQMLTELKKEIGSADRIDMLVSFIKWSGLRELLEELRSFTAHGGKLRVICTSYMGATDVKAVEELDKLPNTEIKISYDTKRTRLHAKSYIFYRDTGFTTAYIGSSNMSNAALTSGLEWNVKAAVKDMADTIEKVRATFASYWNDSEFVLYDASQRDRLIQALRNEKYVGEGTERKFVFDIRPYAYQQEILDKLEVERQVFGHTRNLVVAATGCGKTVISAFDYARFRKAHPGEQNRLLFVAHREEILEQSIETFRGVLRCITAAGYETGMAHISNSAALLRFPELTMGGERIGSALLGRLSFSGGYGLKRIGYCEATVEELRWLPKGHSCGYGAGWTAKKPTRVAVFSVGWYHGFGVEMGNDLFRFRDCLRGVLRNLRQMIFKKHITVTVNGKKCRVLGHIGMLHTCVDVTNVPCAVGDPAVFDLKPLLLKGIEVVYR